MTLCACKRDPEIYTVAEIRAAIKKGETETPIELPSLPPQCGTLIPHASLTLNQSWYSALKREMAQLDLANDNTSQCAAFYRRLERELEGP